MQLQYRRAFTIFSLAALRQLGEFSHTESRTDGQVVQELNHIRYPG